MDWQGRRESSNVDDERSSSGGGGMGDGGGGGGGGLGLIMMIGRMFGFKGVLVAVVIGGALWMLGIVNQGTILGGGSPNTARHLQISPEDDTRLRFVKVVLGETEDVWTKEFARMGKKYVLPGLVVYRGQIGTGCGNGSAAMGPFYCPEDSKVYIDLGFYDELAQTFHAPGYFAQAYVIAHEIGHHVQKLLGTSDKVAAMRGRPDYNQYSVRLELQADYYAGVWANHSKDDLKLTDSDIQEAMTAANAIGDDMIQKKAQGKITPKAFTHGTAAQRMRWFNKGLQSGRIEDGDTFAMRYEDL